MGASDSASIHKIIDQRFKSIRKYQDQFYGEITVLQDKNSHKSFALVEKTLLFNDNLILQLIENRRNSSNYLIKIVEHYQCSTDFCSGVQKFLFLLQYNPHTLYNEICLRQQKKTPFTYEQLFFIFNNYIEIVQYMCNKENIQNFIVSNKNILYYSTEKLKSLQTLFRRNEQYFEFDLQVLSLKRSQYKQIYLSPQSFMQICKKQGFKAKQLCLQQPNIVFMLGMNFLEILLFADMSQIYSYKTRSINFQLLKKVITRVSIEYGSEISELIKQMTLQNKNSRPELQTIKNYLKINNKRTKNSFSRSELFQHGAIFNNSQIH